MPVLVFTVIFTAAVWLKMISPVTEICEISVEVARAWSGSPTRGSLLAGKRYVIHSSNGDCLAISPHGSRLMVPELPVFWPVRVPSLRMGRLDGEKTYPKSQ
jgi:hypothetical protein